MRRLEMMSARDVETIYEALALGVDAAGPEAEKFLAKAALLLARELGDAARAVSLIESAARNLEAPTRSPSNPARTAPGP